MESVKHKFFELSQTKIKLEIEVLKEKVVSETEKVFLEIQHQASIKGFRPGKAPANLVREKYLATARQHVIEDLINETLYEILKEKELNFVGSPVIEKINFEFEKPFTYSAVMELHPKITAKNYRGLKLKKEIKKITEKDVENTIDELKKMNTKLEVTEDISGSKDAVIINYSTEFKELNTENQLIDLSEKQAFDGLAEALTGVKKGDKIEVLTKIPANYINKEIAGRGMTLKVEIKEVKKKIVPELNDEFAKEVGTLNVSDLKSKIKEKITEEAEKRAGELLEEQMVNQLLESNKVDVPESLLESQKNYLARTAVERIKYQGIPAGMIEQQKATIEKKASEEAFRQLKLYYILNSIAEQEKFDVTEEEYNQKREEAIKMNPEREKFIGQYFKDGQERLMSRMKTDKIFKFLKDNAKIKVTEV